MPKVISEFCELVKLCHINCSGPVFLRHTVIIMHLYRPSAFRSEDRLTEALIYKTALRRGL